VLLVRIGFDADPDPAFYVNADKDPDPMQEPDAGQTLKSKIFFIFLMKNTLAVQ
jgi:hypothetical protein